MKTITSPFRKARLGNTSFLICCAILACFLAQSSRAELLFQDSFDYDSGGLAGNGSWLNSGTRITVVEGDLSYSGFTGVVPEGNRARVNGQGASVQYTYASFEPVTSGKIYASFLMDLSIIGNNYTFAGLVQSTHAGTFSSTYDPIDLSSIPISGGGGYQLGVRTFGKSAIYTGLPVLAPNTTQLVVLRYDFETRTASYFVNPDLAGEEPEPTAFSSNTSLSAPTDIGRLYFRIGGETQGNYYFDDVRVGTTWADVVVVPEPGTFSLIAAGFLGLALCRRSRH